MVDLAVIIFGLLIVQGNTREQGWTSHRGRKGGERNPTHKASKIIIPKLLMVDR